MTDIHNDLSNISALLCGCYT